MEKRAGVPKSKCLALSREWPIAFECLGGATIVLWRDDVPKAVRSVQVLSVLSGNGCCALYRVAARYIPFPAGRSGDVSR